MDNNDNYLTFETFKQLFPNARFFLTYRGVIGAIKKYQHQTKVELVANYKVQEPKVWVYIQKGNKYLKSMFVKSEALPAGARRWNQKFEDLNWKNMFKKCFKTTIDTQLRWFQIRLVHRILATGRFIFFA